jgi:hypothetical protein
VKWTPLWPKIYCGGPDLRYITLVEIKEGYLFCLQKGKGFSDENFRELNAYCLPLPLSFPHLFVPCLTYYFKPNWSFVVYLLYSRPGDTNAYCLDIQLCPALHFDLGQRDLPYMELGQKSRPFATLRTEYI